MGGHRDFELWMLPYDIDTPQTIFGRLTAAAAPDYLFMLGGGGLVWLQDVSFAPEPAECEVSLTADAPEPGRWHHLALTYERTTDQGAGASNPVSLWIDGELAASCDMAQKSDGDGTLTLGARHVPAFGTRPEQFDQPFDGLVGAFRVSDTVRYTEAFTPQRFLRSDDDTTLLWLGFNDGQSIGDYSGNNTTAVRTLLGDEEPPVAPRTLCDLVDRSPEDDPVSDFEAQLTPRGSSYERPLRCGFRLAPHDPEDAELTTAWSWTEDGLDLAHDAPLLDAEDVYANRTYLQLDRADRLPGQRRHPVDRRGLAPQPARLLLRRPARRPADQHHRPLRHGLLAASLLRRRHRHRGPVALRRGQRSQRRRCLEE